MTAHLSPPPVPVTLCVAVAVYALFWPLIVPDVDRLMIPWLLQVERGGVAAPVGNYPPAYAYLLDVAARLHGPLSALSLVKAVAVASVAAMAGAVAHLLRVLGVARPARWGALVLVLPSAAINGALIGQVDGLWVAPCVMAVAAAVRRRPAAMLAWWGLGFAFKSQAIFLAPFVAGCALRWRTPPMLWLLTPAVAIGSVLPAVAAGWPVRALALLYAGQVGQFPQLSFNAPNVWAIVMGFSGADGLALKAGIVGVAVLASAGLVLGFRRDRGGDGRRLVDQALLASLVTVGLLPLMHERYFLLADVLALAAAIAAPSRGSTARALLVQAGSLGGLLAFLSGIPGLAALGAVPMMLATAALLRDRRREPVIGGTGRSQVMRRPVRAVGGIP